MFLFRRKSSNVFYLIYKDPTSNKRKSISTHCKDKKSAREFLKSFIKRDSKPISPVIYLETLESEVIKYVTDNLSKGTLLTYLYTFKQIKTILGSKPITLYNARDIEHYKATRIQTISKTTCNIELRVIKAIFNIAIKWNWLEKNPLKNVKQFPLAEKKPLIFSDTDIEKIYSVIESPVLKNIVRFTLLTGLRINEVLNVQLKDINLSERILSINNKSNFKTKSGKNRYIPINDSLLALLNTIIPKSNVMDLNYFETYLFNKKGFRYASDFISKSFKKALRKAGLNEIFHFHCLRHTFITNLVLAGCNVRLIQAIAGHSDLITTEKYIHLGVNDLRQAINLIK